MDNTTRYLKIVLSVLVTLACVYLFSLLRGFFTDVWQIIYTLLLPFLISLVIAYLLQPIVEMLVRRRVPRGVAILVIYLVFVLVVAVAILQAIPAITRQLQQLIEHVPVLMQQANGMIDHLSTHTKYLPDAARKGIESALTNSEQRIAGSISNLFTMLSSTVNAIFVAFVIPFLVFYMLKDAEAIGRTVLRFSPVRWRPYVKMVLVSVDTTIGGYVRGQLLVMTAVGILTWAGFLIVRMPYALLLALFLAMVDVIPFVGPVLGAAPGLIVAWTISPMMALKVLIVNLVVQQLEGNLISPQIMGKTLDLHPMAIVAALLVGGEVGGFLGLIAAVPLLALGKVLFANIQSMRHRKPD